MLPFQIGPLEIVLVLAIALIVLGPKRLPSAARQVGRGVRDFKQALTMDHDDEDETPRKKREPSTTPGLEGENH